MRHSACLLLAAALAAQSQSTPPRPEFEVISIKPAAPPQAVDMGKGVMRMTFSPVTNDPGRYSRSGSPLLLIMQAYGLKNYQVIGPDWIKTERFDITAKKPDDSSADQLLPMVQSMLESRFQLKFHREQRELPILELSIGKGGPKLTESPATPAPPPAPTGKYDTDADGFPILPPGRSGGAMNNGRMTDRYVQTTMQMLADMLTGRLSKPVLDRTGLSGKYEILLRYVQDPGAEAGADAPIGPTLIEAIQSQLGLRLEPKKGMVEVFVIDHVARPIEN